jgi:hypothetical protein
MGVGSVYFREEMDSSNVLKEGRGAGFRRSEHLLGATLLVCLTGMQLFYNFLEMFLMT